MNLTMSGHHLEITPAIREYMTTKLAKVTRHFDNVIDINVIMTVEKLVQKVEATLHVRGNDIFAEASHADLYAAIDALIDKLDRLVLKHKEKRSEKRHEGGHRHLNEQLAE